MTELGKRGRYTEIIMLIYVEMMEITGKLVII